MKTSDSFVTEKNSPLSNGRLDGVTILLYLVAIVISAASALAIGQLGAVVLLVIPALILLIVVFVQPDYGLSFFIFVTVTQVSNVAIKFYGAPSIAQPLAGLLMVVILLRIVLLQERPLSLGRIAPVLVIYTVALFLSLFTSIDFTLSSTTFIGFFKDALGGVIVVLLIQRAASFRQAVWALIIAGIFMGSISVLQTVTRTYDNPYFGFGGWESQSSGEQSRSRLTGPYDNPNAYSQVMIVIFALALERFWHEKRSLLRVFAGWAAIVSGLAIIFTYSRGGVLTLAATTVVLFLLNRPRILPVLITAGIGLALIQFLPADYTQHIGTLQDLIPAQNNNQIYDSSFRGRLSENLAAWQMFMDHPVFGIGLGNYEVQYQNYSRQIGLDSRRVTRSPSSIYLEILSEQGLIGALVFILFIYTIFTGLFSARRQFAAIGLPDSSNLTMALIAGFAGYMIAAIVKNSAYANVYWILAGMAVGAIQVANYSAREKRKLTHSVQHYD
ncbi:MAG: O-antigen ligase family protein [Chloroflexi bacterium]|nr:O-antigen ligase family protein [Chloroflexota bacterium]